MSRWSVLIWCVGALAALVPTSVAEAQGCKPEKLIPEGQGSYDELKFEWACPDLADTFEARIMGREVLHGKTQEVQPRVQDRSGADGDTGGHSVAQVARDLDVRPDMIRRWRKKLEQEDGDAFPGAGRLKPSGAELQRLRRDLKRIRQERDILKKALAIFSDRPR